MADSENHPYCSKIVVGRHCWVKRVPLSLPTMHQVDMGCQLLSETRPPATSTSAFVVEHFLYHHSSAVMLFEQVQVKCKTQAKPEKKCVAGGQTCITYVIPILSTLYWACLLCWNLWKILSKNANLLGSLGWLNWTRQDQSSTEKYLNPKQLSGGGPEGYIYIKKIEIKKLRTRATTAKVSFGEATVVHLAVPRWDGLGLVPAHVVVDALLKLSGKECPILPAALGVGQTLPLAQVVWVTRSRFLVRMTWIQN